MWKTEIEGKKREKNISMCTIVFEVTWIYFSIFDSQSGGEDKDWVKHGIMLQW